MVFSASITLQPQFIIGAVDPHLYGANLEHIGQTIYGALWAEMLRDRKFAGHDRMYTGLSEGLSHEHSAFGVVVPWQPVNPDRNHVLFVHDNTTFYTGRQSQRITIRHDDGLEHGIQQRGLYLDSTKRYEIRLVLKGEGQPVKVTLGGQSQTIPAAPSDWTTFPLTFAPTAINPAGALAITFQGVGSLWVGCASVMPADHVAGFRPDVVAAIQEWTPTFLRWPGGNVVSAYHWLNGVGDRDLRPDYLDPAWNLREPNDVGTDEFIALCRMIGSEPVLTVNMGNGTPEEAAAWVEYCNGAASTPYGALRTANGSPEPYNVKTWFVGNEQFGNWQVGHVDAETYARDYLRFAAAMRAVDPTLHLIGVGVPTDLYGHWNELVLGIAGHAMDSLSVHYYSIRTEKWDAPPPTEGLYLPKVAAAHEVALMLDRTFEIISAHSSPPLPIAFDEWNTYIGAKAPAYIEDYNLADALYTGAVMNACLQRCDRINLSAIYNLINVMGSYITTPLWAWEQPTRPNYWVGSPSEPIAPPSVYKMPATLVMELFTQQRGSSAVRCTTTTPVMATPECGNLPALNDVPLIDAAATYDAQARVVYLSIVNRDPAQSAQIVLEGIQIDPQRETITYTVTGDDLLATNTADAPHAVTTAEARLRINENSVLIAPHSFTMLVIPTASS